MEFLAKLFFIRKLGLDGTRLIQEQQRVLNQTIEHMKTRFEKEKDPHRRLAAGFKRATAEAWRGWLVDEALPFVKETDPT